MEKIEITKRNRVEADSDFKSQGVIAFEIVDFKINYFGNIVETSHDTKIMADGSQFVIGGCGYIPEGYQVV